MRNFIPTLVARIVLFSILSVFLLESCQTQGSSQNIAGCQATNMSNNATSGSEIISSSLDSAGPIELPITIAKGIEGVDPSSIEFTPTASPSLSADSQNLKFATSQVIGTLSGQILTRQTGRVALFLDSTLNTLITTNSDGTFAFSITESIVNAPLALVVVPDTFTSSFYEETSAPVIITVYFDTFSQTYDLQVSITNTDSGIVNEDIALDILSENIATSYSDSLAVMGTNPSNLFSVSENLYLGGINDNLTNSLTTNLEYLAYDKNDNLYGSSSTDGSIKEISNLGVIATLDDFSNYPTSARMIKMHPSGLNYLAATILVAHPSLNQNTYTVGIIDLTTGDTTAIPIRTSETKLAIDVSFAWSSYSHLVILKTYSDSTFELLEYDILKNLNASSFDEDTLYNQFSSSNLMRNPSNNNGFFDFIYYECLDSNDIMQLCRFDRDAGNEELLTSEDFDVSDIKTSWDGTYLTYMISGISGDDSFYQMVLYDFDAEDTTYFGSGNKPTTNPVYPNLIPYFVNDVNNGWQLAIKNISNTKPNSLDLEGNPPSLQLPVGGDYGFLAKYGLGPYTFALDDSSIGSLDTNTGYFEATTKGVSDLIVTDANGDTTSITITVGDDIMLFDTTGGTVTVGTSFTVSTNGGGSSFNTFSIISGSGSIDSETGVYTAPSVFDADPVTIQIDDGYGNTDSFTFNLVNP